MCGLVRSVFVDACMSETDNTRRNCPFHVEDTTPTLRAGTYELGFPSSCDCLTVMWKSEKKMEMLSEEDIVSMHKRKIDQ